ncbi:autophagy-like protein 18 [Capronia epimyces CBS 606.96]|uniref:Autophagy-related protein 18 n=1 Tax=Capronia epimyces CBS 606.96 TaxID=1182542 RepID=W9YQU7_9EURO|nr:autophagy-like protein 18 [Capronia epimyces CBS 606.96]EXJ84644.1 autophagy-like protein 18 [Capronia epimyces CBS 606.96]
MAMNFVTFNQDYSHLAVGTSRGFRIFTTDPFAKCYESREAGNIAILEMLFSTSLVALILSPRRLQIKNTKRDSIICELTFPTTVLAVRLNRKRLVIVLEDQIYLYDIQTMRLLYTIETSPNPTGKTPICALSPSSENCYLAYPLPQKAAGSSAAPPSHAPPSATHIAPTSGEVLLFDAVKLEAVNVVEAHRSPLSCVTFNNEGTILATASDKGTIIRIFSVPDAHKLYQFRRGSMPARIYSMAFNITSTLLCVSSATETVHIFKLGPQTARTTDESEQAASPTKSSGAFTRRLSQGSDSAYDLPADDEDEAESPTALTSRKPNGTFMGLLRRTSQHVGINLATTVGGYLPKGVAEMWEPSRDFAWVRLLKSNSGTSPSQLRSVVAMSPNSPQVMVVTNEGNFYVFSIDLAKGGEGTLIKQYS